MAPERDDPGPAPLDDHRDELSAERRGIFEVAALVNDIQHRADTNVRAVLRDINAVTVESVPGAQYAGITVVDHGIESLAPTHAVSSALDDVQRETGQGPCLTATWNHHTVVIDDLSTETRWPLYRDAAIERTAVRSILSIRLASEGHRLAALNLFAEPAHAFDEESIELALIYATHTTAAWNLMRRQEQFQSALASRDVIGQAKGILMERFDINAADAFDLLRRLSQESNMKLVDLAVKLVDTDHP